MIFSISAVFRSSYLLAYASVSSYAARKRNNPIIKHISGDKRILSVAGLANPILGKYQ